MTITPGGKSAYQEARPPALDKLWYTRCPVPTALGIAVHRGWFDDEFSADGITLGSLQEIDAADKRESHFDHSLPHSFRQGGNIPALWARSLMDTYFALDPIQTGVSQGQFDNHYRWRLQVAPWVAPGVAPAGNANAMQMYRLDLDVIWGSAPFEHKAHFSTLRIGSPNNAAPSL